MSLPRTTGGYGLGPGEGEALWFNGGLGVLRATGDQTQGRFAAIELLAPKGFASPLHIHRGEDEFFVVLSGEVRVQHGDAVTEAAAGSVVYGPRDVAHAFHVDSAEARLLLFFGPAGVEGFFREGGKPAGFLGLPPADEQFLDQGRQAQCSDQHIRSSEPISVVKRVSLSPVECGRLLDQMLTPRSCL